MKKNRKVKLYSKSRPCQSHYTELKEVPWLNVSGVWLEQDGFGICDQVEIKVSNHQLIINPVSNGDTRD